jgi:hypothetical protein
MRRDSLDAVRATTSAHYHWLPDASCHGAGEHSRWGDSVSFRNNPVRRLVDAWRAARLEHVLLPHVRQLGDAEAFLASHPGQVAFVTIDIGGNDLAPCFLSIPINAACFAAALPIASANLETIVTGLRTAGGAVPIVGMTYYDPFPAYWLEGGDGQTAAHDSLKLVKSGNRALKVAYEKHRAALVADGQRAFATTKKALTGSYNGEPVPVNVAQVCAWTFDVQRQRLPRQRRWPRRAGRRVRVGDH